MRRWVGAATMALAALVGSAQADVRRTDDEVALPPYACDEGAGAPAGTVIAVTGEPVSALPGCPPRALECGSVVYANSAVATYEGALVALEVGDHVVQAGPDARFTVAPADGPRPPLVGVERGAVRVMQVGGDLPTPIRVATPSLETVGPVEDAVAQVPRDGAAASICSYAAPVEVRDVAGRAAVATSDAAPCVGAGATAAGATAGAVTGAAPLPSIADVGECALAGHFDPVDVASGPVGPNFPLFPPVPPPPPYCLNGTCTNGDGPPPNKGHTGVPLVEQPAGYEPPP